MALFDLDTVKRTNILKYTTTVLEDYYGQAKQREVSPDLDIQKVRSYISEFASRSETDYKKIIDHVLA